MIFTDEHITMILGGAKTQTRRVANDKPRSPWYRGRCGLTVGRAYAIRPARNARGVARVVVDDARLQQLGHITLTDAYAEGYDTVEQYAAVWAAINGVWQTDLEVWAITFHPAVA